MNGPDLRALRENRKLSQSELAAYLGDTTTSTISRWENSRDPVPAWVAEKMLRTVEITLPMQELEALIEAARRQNMSFSALLRQSIIEHLDRHRPH
ncbi:MAG: helix-turn-helix transcriptional regulator [Verrucomicrobiales bacterium]|nr:helix-turn-helix transcriptional regulator [Verrucomicrobiales bacterium]